MAETQMLEYNTSSEELAYMLIEEARLRCRLLLDDIEEAGADPDGLNLSGLTPTSG